MNQANDVKKQKVQHQVPASNLKHQQQKASDSCSKHYYEYQIYSIKDLIVLVMIYKLSRFPIFQTKKNNEIKKSQHCKYICLYLSDTEHSQIQKYLQTFGIQVNLIKRQQCSEQHQNLGDLCLLSFFNENKYSILKLQKIPLEEFEDILRQVTINQIFIQRISQNSLLLTNKMKLAISSDYHMKEKDEFAELMTFHQLKLLFVFEDFIEFCQYNQKSFPKEQINTQVFNSFSKQIYLYLYLPNEEIFEKIILQHFRKLEKIIRFRNKSQQYQDQHSYREKFLIIQNQRADQNVKPAQNQILQSIQHGDIYSLKYYENTLRKRLQMFQRDQKVQNSDRHATKQIIYMLRVKIKKFTYKKKQFNIYDYLYPEITKLVEKLYKKYFILQKGQANLQVKQQKLLYSVKDIYLLSYIDSLILKHENLEHNCQLLSRVYSLQDFIQEVSEFYYCRSHWEDLYNYVTLKFQIKTAYQQQQYQRYIKSLERYSHPDLSCLGCAQFYLSNTNLASSKIPVHVKVFQDLKCFQDQHQMIQTICTILNSKGGIVYFNCKRQYIFIRPKVQSIVTEQEKRKIEQLLTQYLDEIEPRPSNQQVVLKFVPVGMHPLDKNAAKVNYQQHPYPVLYQQGWFVPRIKICPKNVDTNFCRRNNFPQSQSQKSYIQIKDQKKYRSKPLVPLSHQCKNPEIGKITLNQFYKKRN